MTELNDETTLRVARDYFLEHLGKGLHCPVCERKAKVYRRVIDASMAVAIVKIYQAGGTDWVYKPEVLRGVGPAARTEPLLRSWDLMEEEKVRRPDGGRAGWWRVTPHGEDWIHGRVVVPKSVDLERAAGRHRGRQDRVHPRHAGQEVPAGCAHGRSGPASGPRGQLNRLSPPVWRWWWSCGLGPSDRHLHLRLRGLCGLAGDRGSLRCGGDPQDQVRSLLGGSAAPMRSFLSLRSAPSQFSM